MRPDLQPEALQEEHDLEADASGIATVSPPAYGTDLILILGGI